VQVAFPLFSFFCFIVRGNAEIHKDTHKGDKMRTIGTTRLAIEIKKHFAIYDATGKPWSVDTYMELAEFVLKETEKTRGTQ
jgi:hypothetical protein